MQSLNSRIVRNGSHHSKTDSHAVVTVHFHDIEHELTAFIRQSHKVCLAFAWLRSVRVIQSIPPDSRVLVTNDIRLPRYPRHVTARKIGRARGALRPLMHSKFVISLDSNNNPVAVLTGSYNATNHSTLNLENCVVIRSDNIAAAYMSEFDAMWTLAKRNLPGRRDGRR